MTRTTVRHLPRSATPTRWRRLLRRDPGDALVRVLLVLATMVACAWLAVPDIATDAAEERALAAATIPAEPR